MTITQAPADVTRDLHAGRAVVLTMPTSSLPYVVAETTTTTSAVNEAKGRPATQPAGAGGDLLPDEHRAQLG